MWQSPRAHPQQGTAGKGERRERRGDLVGLGLAGGLQVAVKEIGDGLGGEVNRGHDGAEGDDEPDNDARDAVGITVEGVADVRGVTGHGHVGEVHHVAGHDAGHEEVVARVLRGRELHSMCGRAIRHILRYSVCAMCGGSVPRCGRSGRV